MDMAGLSTKLLSYDYKIAKWITNNVHKQTQDPAS